MPPAENTPAPAQNPNEGGTVITNPVPEAAPAPEGQAPAAEPTPAPAPAEGEQTPPEGEGKAPEGEGEEEKPTGAPEKYEFVAPEGKEFIPEILQAFEEGAREANLTQESAQKLLDKVAPVYEGQMLKAMTTIQDAWLEQTANDKEYGGDKYEESRAYAGKAMAAFGDEALANFLITTKVGNHPDLVRAFVKIGKAISDDNRLLVTSQGSQGKAAGEGYANSLYPNSNMR
jgi:hypothetical protein